MAATNGKTKTSQDRNHYSGQGGGGDFARDASHFTDPPVPEENLRPVERLRGLLRGAKGIKIGRQAYVESVMMPHIVCLMWKKRMVWVLKGGEDWHEERKELLGVGLEWDNAMVYGFGSVGEMEEALEILRGVMVEGGGDGEKQV